MRALRWLSVGVVGVTLVAVADAKPKTPPSSGGASGVVWKDATGTSVDGAVTGTIVNGLYYFDSSGFVWNLTTHDAVIFSALGDFGGIHYETPDCTDEGYILDATVMPRFTFRFFHEST